MRVGAVIGLVGVGLLLAGCGAGDVTGEAAPEGVVAGEPAFSPCDDFPAEVLREVGVDPAAPDRDIGGVKQPGWNRCRWAGSDFSLTVFATTKSMTDIRTNDRNIDQADRNVDGREILVYRESNDVRRERCDVAMRTGDGASIVRVSLFHVEAGADPCSLAVRTAAVLSPSIPE
jgi:hypothetical protein